MATLNLKSLQQKTEKKYPALQIEVDDDGSVLTLRNILRLPKEDRKAFKKIQDARSEREKAVKAAEDAGEVIETEDASAETIAYFRSALTLVADNESLVEKFLDEVGDDLATLATVFEMYVKADPELGEDSSSES